MQIHDFSHFAAYRGFVSPVIAAEWLGTRNKVNRRFRRSVVELYKRDIRAGQWVFTGEPIIFDRDGQIIIGQHRLLAVVETGIGIEVMVVVGIDPAARAVVDTGVKRTQEDAFAYSGHNQMLGEGGNVSGKTASAMWARMKAGLKTTKGKDTRQELIAFAEKYPEGGLFAIEVFSKLPRQNGVSVGPVMAAVARAYYKYGDNPMLGRFAEVLVTGKSLNEREASIHVLIRWLIGDGKGQQKSRNSNDQPEIYGKTARAIIAFMSGQTLEKLYMPSEEPFPLPDRGEAASGADRVPVHSGQQHAGRPGAAPVATPLPLGRAH